MMPRIFSAVMFIWYVLIATSGLSAASVSRPDSTFGLPMPAVVWRIWRWRFDRSTTSPSTSPIVPTPAAAR